MPPPTRLAPKQIALLSVAQRRRGGAKAARRIKDILIREAAERLGRSEIERRKLMKDDADHAWPPKFLTE